MDWGRKSASDVKAFLKISPTRWESLSKEMKDETADLFHRLLEHGVRYVVEGKGRGARSSLVKA
jgi:hypothetical protein